MPFPDLPRPVPGEVLMVCTCYDDGRPGWGGVLKAIGTRGEGGIRLRLVAGQEWDFLHGGNVPALLPSTGLVPPVVLLADSVAVYGGAEPLLIDTAELPGRGVRIPPARLGEVLAAVLGGTLRFDDLVAEMDVRGVYQGRAGRPAFRPSGVPVRRSFPALPATEGALLVRTDFDDEDGWCALLAELGGVDGDGVVGGDVDLDEVDVEHFPLTALAVDDRAFEGLLPGQVPALVPPDEHTTLVALADSHTFTGPGRPLTVVDLYETPGQAARFPCLDVGSIACNLELANIDFFEVVPVEGTDA